VAEKPPASFSDYIKQYESGQTTKSGLVRAELTPSTTGSYKAAPVNEGDFLSGAIDFVSGPLKAITNTAYKALEIPEQYDALRERSAAGEDVSAFEQIAPIARVAAAPATGLFSFFTKNEEDKPWGADLVEKFTDVDNRNNPNYVNTPNNADPITKGAVGFALDVALDPLTYIPGAQYVKAGQLAARAVKATGKVVGQGAGKVTDAVARKIGRVPDVVPTAQEPVGYTLSTRINGRQKIQKFATREEAETALGVLKKKHNKATWKESVADQKLAPKTNYSNIEPEYSTAQTINAAVEDVPAIKLTKESTKALQEARAKGISATDAIAEKVSALVAKNPSFGGDVTTLIKSLRSTPAKVKASKPIKPLAAKDWIDNLSEAVKNGQIENIALGTIKVAGQPPIPMKQLSYALRERAKYMAAGNKGMVAAIDNQLLKKHFDSYKALLANGNEADLLGNPLTKGTPEEVLKEAAVTTMLDRLLKSKSQAAARVRSLFTPAVFEDLKKMDPEEFDVFLDSLQSIIKSNGIASAFGPMSSSPGARAALSVFDITPEMYDDAIQLTKLNVESTVANGVTSVAENIRSIPENGLLIETLRANLEAAGFTAENIDLAVLRVSESLNEAIAKNFDPEFLDDIYKFISDDGTLRTEELFGSGIGKHPNAFNTHTQWDFFNILSKKLTEDFTGAIAQGVGKNKGSAYLGIELARQKELFIIPAMKTMEDFLELKGVPLTMDWKGEVRLLKFTDVYDALRSVFSGAKESDWLRLVLFNGNTGAAPTKIMDAVMEAMRGADADTVFKELTSNNRRNIWVDSGDVKMAELAAVREDETIFNWLSGDPVEGIFGYRAGTGEPKSSLMPGKRAVKYDDLPAYLKTGFSRPKDDAYYFLWDNKVAAAKLAEALHASAPALAKLDNARATEWAARGVSDYKTMSPLVAGQIIAATKTPELAGQAIRLAANPGKVVAEFSAGMNATQLGAGLTSAAITQGITPAVQRTASHMISISKAVETGDPAKVTTAYRSFIEEARKTGIEDLEKIKEYIKGSDEFNYSSLDDATRAEFDDMVDELYYDLSKSLNTKTPNGEASVMGTLRAILDPLRQAFTPDFKMRPEEFLWAAREERKSNMFVRQFMAKRMQPLNDLAADPRFKALLDGKTTVFQQAVRNIQQGVKGTGVVGEAQAALEGHLAFLVNIGKSGNDSILASPFGRAGLGLRDLNEKFRSYQVLGGPSEDLIDIADAIATSQASGGKISVFQAGIDQWKTWDIQNPLEFIGRMNAAAVRIAADTSFVRNFEVEALAKNLASTTPVKGFVKIVSTGDSYFGDMFPKDTYFHPDVAEVLHAIDVKSRASKNLQGEFGAFINKTLDPILGEWKYAITLIRPGHHVRNLFGDLSMTYFAEGVRNFRRSSTDAFRLMSMTNDYKDIDIIRTLNNLEVTIPKGSETMISGKLAGNKIKLTASDVLVAAKERGLMLPAQVVEDLFDAEIKNSPIAKLARGVSTGATLGMAKRGGGAERFFSGISEYREHTVKLQHFVQIMHNASEGKGIITGVGKIVYPKTIDEMLDIAARRVMKYHPDVTTLTAFETKYMRRIIPFYSWTKQAVIAMGEATVMAPGRVLAIPKASYNLGIAMGIDPYSLSEPFPADQLFPSFLTEEMLGPQFEYDNKYYGFNPGIASVDIYNMLAPDPIRGILGSTNPLLKAPLEAISGTNLGTGAPIRDFSDWLDSQIPGVNYISNVGGYSVTGSIVRGLRRGELDPQYQVAAGNKSFLDRMLSGVNWLTGAGIRSYSRPNYINYAEIELRNRLGGEEKNF